ncbi:amidase [Ensifer sp. ENS04]|uniref:amidase n=1 Tax=Ensifer sp. ENS04 TaxID=2769281 RepID=UPI001783523C|nr:amidase [Ensifer sp. ENS04]MBD9541399.1 amidase [Ensifer sp. ENS04]
MPVRRPSKAEIEELGRRRHLHLTEAEIEDMHELVCENMSLYDQLEQTPEPIRESVPAIRTVGTRPDKKDDPYNAVTRLCSVQLPGAKGKLSGKTIGIKDTVAVAGIPMAGASRVLYDFTPTMDAPIVTRILEAGGHITAMLNTDDFAFSGAGHTSANGIMLNPVDPNFTAGGSSGGSSIAVATGLVDIAMGGDQGGSIRIPAAWTGTVGHKPTHGLVPYTGILGFDQTLDHIGPHSRTVEDSALMLSVIAGKDHDVVDPRQPSSIEVQDYLGALTGDLRGLRIAVVKEGFEMPHAMEEVNYAVREAIKLLPSLGATVEEISVPQHLDVPFIWNSIAGEGGVTTFYAGHHSLQNKGWYDTRLMSAMGRGIKSHGGDFSPTAKAGILVAAYMAEQYQGVFYGRARNLANALTRTYNKVFEKYDLVVMPTTPQTAHAVPESPDVDRKTFVRIAMSMVGNCAAFDLTGNPSISVPCHDVKGMPVGLMFTGRAFDDATVLRAGHAYEQAKRRG